MADEFDVTHANTRGILESNGERVAKFSHHRTYHDIGGRVKLEKGATYVLVIGRHFIDEEIEFRLRTFAYGEYSIK